MAVKEKLWKCPKCGKTMMKPPYTMIRCEWCKFTALFEPVPEEGELLGKFVDRHRYD